MAPLCMPADEFRALKITTHSPHGTGTDMVRFLASHGMPFDVVFDGSAIGHWLRDKNAPQQKRDLTRPPGADKQAMDKQLELRRRFNAAVRGRGSTAMVRSRQVLARTARRDRGLERPHPRAPPEIYLRDTVVRCGSARERRDAVGEGSYLPSHTPTHLFSFHSIWLSGTIVHTTYPHQYTRYRIIVCTRVSTVG